MDLALQTGQNRLDFLVDRERYARYRSDTSTPGFTRLTVAGERTVTRSERADGLALWLAHGDVNGIAFGSEGAEGRIVPLETLARRGSQSVGFQQTCAWLAPDDRRLLTEVRTIRVVPGPSEGRAMDIAVCLTAPPDAPVRFGLSEAALLCFRAASPLCPAGGGQMRNSAGNYGPAEMHGRRAGWCAGVGVVDGETVGFALLDHPANPGSPSPWIAREDGFLYPAPFAWNTLRLDAGESLSLRYRILVHRGYVEQGWADARHAAFAKSRPL